MTRRRCDIVDEENPTLYHCMSRCVRRSYLLDDDPDPETANERRDWVLDDLIRAADVLAVEVLSFSVMGNHLHIVVLTRPDLVAEWTDEECACQWLEVYPPTIDGERIPVTPEQVATIVNNRERLAKIRKRLSSLGEFHKLVKERTAKRANKQDGVTGSFWSPRFKSKPILDQAALLATMVYVDLNPIRAKIAETPESSSHTSIQERIYLRQAYMLQRSYQGRVPESAQDGTWLCPFDGDPEVSPLAGVTLEDYLALVDWTGRIRRADKRGAIDETRPPILERLAVESARWRAMLKALERKQPGSVIATTAAIAQEAARRQCKRLVNVLESFPVTLKRVAEQMSGIFKREHSAVGVVPDIVTLPEGQEESVGGSPFARVQQRARRQGSRPPGD